MSWLDKQVSLYNTHADNIGRPATYRQILLCEFGIPRQINGIRVNDLETIVELRNLNREAPDYRPRKMALKALLQCYTPAGLLATKEAGKMTEISRTGILQLDFDYQDIHQYDVEDLKKGVFNLPFIAFCGLSCSGDGFYALALIAEPDRLSEYAEHLFQVFLQYDIKADQSKGKKVENLRYLSYDCNMLIRDNPQPLRIIKFNSPQKQKTSTLPPQGQYIGSANALVNAEISKIKNATVGQRWATVQHVAYTLGGLGDQSIIYPIKSEIEANPAFAGEESKYCKCAVDCFNAGALKPLSQKTTQQY